MLINLIETKQSDSKASTERFAADYVQSFTFNRGGTKQQERPLLPFSMAVPGTTHQLKPNEEQ